MSMKVKDYFYFIFKKSMKACLPLKKKNKKNIIKIVKKDKKQA